jgi:hypothetical protein
MATPLLSERAAPRVHTVDMTLCAFSRDTIAACRFYEPIAAHSSRPGSERCRHELETRDSATMRMRLCSRVSTLSAHV